eukprot:15443030-Alexandrium_andersonii.AAC.1
MPISCLGRAATVTVVAANCLHCGAQQGAAPPCGKAGCFLTVCSQDAASVLLEPFLRPACC